MVAPLPSASAVRVLVVADDPLARGGLAGLLRGEPGLSLAGQLAPAAVAQAPPHDVVAWDLGLDAAGLERFRHRPRAIGPAVTLVDDVDTVGDALGAGARGVLSRGGDPARLAAALRAVPAGLVVVDESLAGGLGTPRSPESVPDGLSPREHEVLELLAEGLPNKLVADRLGISEHTAKFHINAIFDKLGVTSRTEAVVRAVRLGWLTL